ncbi:hypothetical protein C6558_33595 [Ensifer sp. NM-2]|nr:hypothetical protein C6558_33595 [Ensifer sp. NM-2]
MLHSASRAGIRLTAVDSSAAISDGSSDEGFEYLVFAPRFFSDRSVIAEQSGAQLETVFEEVFWSFWRFVKEYMPRLREGGRLVVLLPNEVALEVPGRSAAASATAATRAMLKGLSLELEDGGISVVTILLSTQDCLAMEVNASAIGDEDDQKRRLENIADAMLEVLSSTTPYNCVYL